MHIWSCDLKCMKLDYAFVSFLWKMGQLLCQATEGHFTSLLPFQHILQVLFCHFIFNMYY